MRIVSWNVNSLKPRQDRFFRFLDRWQPDVVCLQETKSLVEDLPNEAIESAGWHLAAVGLATPTLRWGRSDPGDDPTGAPLMRLDAGTWASRAD